MVAELNPGQVVHCPSVLHLNWPTGQAAEDGSGQQRKQISLPSDSEHNYSRFPSTTLCTRDTEVNLNS